MYEGAGSYRKSLGSRRLAGAAMDLFNGITVSEENLLFFAAGLSSGSLLWAALQASLRGGNDQSKTLATRVAKLEMRLAAGKDFTAIASAMRAFESVMPVMSGPNVVTLFSTVDLPQVKPSKRTPDPEQIAKEFGEAMRDNTVAAVEIAKSIIDQGINLDNPADRKAVTAKIKKFGTSLSTKFWDSYGDLMLSSSLSQNLKDLLRVFFAQVKRLKAAVTELSKEPSFAELDSVLDRAIDLLDTAKAIVDELERLSAN